MTYATERDRIGREPVTIVEIDLDKCAEVYGVGACTASKAAALSCHNTRKTCQDPDNYNNTSITTYKFSDRDIDGENYIPCIKSNTLSPIAITPGQPFNKRASITIQLTDFSHHDVGIDPYVASRSYTPMDQGTYFGKLIARNPFYQGRPLRLITGYIDTAGTLQTQTENYILEAITFGKKGMVTIIAKDILKLADDERSFAPVASTGKLEAAITAAATSLTVTSGTESEYNAESDFIRIGDEIIEAPAANRSSNVFSNLTRGAWNTTAATHAIDDAVQACLHYDAVNVRDIIDDLLVNYAGISSSYITAADWDAEQDKWLAGHNLTALLTEPYGINTLLDEISEQLMVYIWWDAVNQKIRMRAIAPPDTTLITLDEDDHIMGEVEVSIEAEDRKTRCIVFYNPRTPLDFDNSKDFESLYVNIDAGEESADKNNDIRQKVIYARWITSDSVAATTASRTVNQFRETPKVMTFMVDAKDTADNAVGDYINIQTRKSQAFDGSNDTTLVQILSIEEKTTKAPGSHYKFTVQQAQFGGRYARIMSASDASVYSSASDAEKAAGCYIVAAGNTYFSDGGEAYKIP